MAEQPPIRIGRKPDGSLSPDQEPIRRRMKKGDSVRFTTTPDVNGIFVEFQAGRSPFGGAQLKYGELHTVAAAFDGAHPANNVYVYKCHATGPQPPAGAEGGEVEIVP